MADDRVYDDRGRPTLRREYSYDVDAARHFLADHAQDPLVALDHHARNPDVFIYIETPDGTLSAGDYHLWPALHQTSARIDAELDEMRRDTDGWRWNYWRSGLRKWAKRMPQLHNLNRIRKSTIHALRAWDLQDRRSRDLVVLNTDRDLTGLNREEVLEMVEESRADGR